MASAKTHAKLLLQKQLKELLNQNVVEGFSTGLVNENDIFVWKVTILDPIDTIYEGGMFDVMMMFPPDYPNSPPEVCFKSEMWHPNVYTDGHMCISILHAPSDDLHGYEKASEWWLPMHTIMTIILSIISMLFGPNDELPANVDVAIEWREKRDVFRKKVARIVRRSQEML